MKYLTTQILSVILILAICACGSNEEGMRYGVGFSDLEELKQSLRTGQVARHFYADQPYHVELNRKVEKRFNEMGRDLIESADHLEITKEPFDRYRHRFETHPTDLTLDVPIVYRLDPMPDFVIVVDTIEDNVGGYLKLLCVEENGMWFVCSGEIVADDVNPNRGLIIEYNINSKDEELKSVNAEVDYIVGGVNSTRFTRLEVGKEGHVSLAGEKVVEIRILQDVSVSKMIVGKVIGEEVETQDIEVSEVDEGLVGRPTSVRGP